MIYSLLDAATTAGGTTATPTASWTDMIPTIVMMVAMIAVFYFLLIRPQRKKDKEAKAMLDALKVGDHITTIGGINATIVNIKDQTLTVEVGAPGEAQKSKMTIERWAVRNVNQLTIENDAETLI